MANGTVYVDARINAPKDYVMVVGRGFMGEVDHLRPQDIDLRRIDSVVFSPWRNLVAANRRVIYMQGSIGSLGVLDTSTSRGSILGNYVRVRIQKLQGSGPRLSGGTMYGGTFYIGSAGSQRFSFIAAGR